MQETNLWNSVNPLGSIIYINIPVDDGVVVCTEYETDYWYFMTMNAPYAGNHPVSGTRQFGYESNSDGSYNFFVRGVDRFDFNVAQVVAFGVSGFDDAFSGADAVWESFQVKLNDFINNPINSNPNDPNTLGSSIVVPPTKNRPSWEEVRNVLEGVSPISDLGCD